jgi:hypothetical protein
MNDTDHSPETETCPEHGVQEVLRHSASAGADPYDVQHLACGHRVTCFGPGEDNVILGAGRPARPRTSPRPADGDTRDGLCDDCCHAPGEHPVAAVYAYCDTKHEHEARVITDGSVAYAAGSVTDTGAVYLQEALTSTATPRGGMILAASCGQPLPGSDDPCQGDLRWVIAGDDWNHPRMVSAEDRATLTAHGTRIEDL